MNWLQAFILGLVQGLTEFFPVSSSAHLKIIKSFFHIQSTEEIVFFDLFCHMGTALSLILYFRKEIWNILFKERRWMGIYFIALLPLIPLYFFLKPLRDAASEPHLLGYFLLLTATILFIGQQKKTPPPLEKPLKASFKDAVVIGTSQALALIPGISRSASTISTARFLGWSASNAVRFSFLLSIPAIFGGLVLESIKIFRAPISPAIPLDLCLIGGLTSFSAGLLTVSFALRYLSQGNLKPFAWYCLALGLLTLLVFKV